MTKVSELAAASALAGNEEFLIVQVGVSKRASGDVVADLALGRAQRVAKVALGDADTPGGILAWPNPEGADIIVYDVIFNLTTTTADDGDTNFASAGLAANGTTLDATIKNTIPLGSLGAPLVLPANTGKAPVLLPAGYYVTVSTASGSADGLVGFAYIYWHPAA